MPFIRQTGATSTPGADGDGKTGQELAESVKQDQVKTSSRERSCSSERAAVVVVVPEPEKAAKVKKVEKRPITTRRSLSRRVKRQCPPRDTTAFGKSEESLISLSDSQESLKGQPASQPVELPLKRSRADNDDDEDDEQGEANAEAVDEKLAIVPAPEVLNFKEAEDDAPAKPEVGAGWNELEMGLYEKGLQIFGKNRYELLIMRMIMPEESVGKC